LVSGSQRAGARRNSYQTHFSPLFLQQVLGVTILTVMKFDLDLVEAYVVFGMEWKYANVVVFAWEREK